MACKPPREPRGAGGKRAALAAAEGPPATSSWTRRPEPRGREAAQAGPPPREKRQDVFRTERAEQREAASGNPPQQDDNRIADLAYHLIQTATRPFDNHLQSPEPAPLEDQLNIDKVSTRTRTVSSRTSTR
ncbi:unnamed protein product [Prorocentrum cordatum]|uniref:Uncharacterized protein n=1 Tax=Prorocentrum cordatum TaxID=2364126 RepID=A0ABN9WQD7_9DINO|nr:unnamed protein product [Polarella glacialis]